MKIKRVVAVIALVLAGLAGMSFSGAHAGLVNDVQETVVQTVNGVVPTVVGH